MYKILFLFEVKGKRPKAKGSFENNFKLRQMQLSFAFNLSTFTLKCLSKGLLHIRYQIINMLQPNGNS